MLTRLWIVVPCYYDLPSFAELKRRAHRVLAQALPDFQITTVLIDDTGGQDLQISEQLKDSSNLVLTVPYNLGHQGAIAFGLRKLAGIVSENDFIVTMDSDGEDRPEDIPALLKPMLLSMENEFLVCVAQRTKRSEGLLFKTMYTCFRLFFQTLTGTVVRNGNFAAFRGWFVKNVLFHPYFDYCYSSSLLALSHQIRGVPLERGKRYHGQSKMTLISLISHGLRMLLPFSERIAVRGMILSCMLIFAVTALSLVTFVIAMTGYKPAVLVILGLIPVLVLSVVVLAASWIFFQTFNHARAMSLRYTTISAVTTADHRHAAGSGMVRSMDESLLAVTPYAET